MVASRLFLVAAVVAFVAVTVGVVNVALRRAEIEREVEAVRSELRQAARGNAELERLLSYLATPEFQEREARLRAGLRKPGENVVVVPGSEPSGEAVAPAPPELPNWRRWYNYFFSPR